jgi:predicted porin
MKKLILAAAVAAVASTSVNAATIYEGKGLTYKMKGDWQIQLRDNASQTKDAEVEVDDLEIKNSIIYDLNNGMKAFGQIDFGFKKAAEDEIDGSHLEEAYVGLDFGSVKVAIGKQNFASDEFGVEEAYETYTKEDRFDAKSTDGDDVIRVDVNMENFTFVASTELAAEGEASENGEYFDLFVSTELAGVELAAAYQSDEIADEDTWGVSASTKIGGVKLAADYSTTDTAAGDLDLYNVAVKFKASETTTIALGLIEEEKSTTVDRSQIYANVTYKFPAQQNVSLFAEIADVDEDGKDLDLDVLAGMRIKF